MLTQRATRNVSLTSELDAFVEGQVASGRYRTASEVVRAALRLLQERERPNDQKLKPASLS
jgi:putative addiction module CopG family antidote